MLSKRNGHFGHGEEISPDTFIYDHDGTGDEAHPHYYCNAGELIALFDGFELMSLSDIDHSHRRPGHWHWHMVYDTPVSLRRGKYGSDFTVSEK